MARIHFTLRTSRGPDAVLGALTDFSEHRAEVWPNIDRAHFQLHGQGPGWAEATEGSSVAGGIWERNRYEWDPDGGRVSVTTLDSNTWGAGSRWDYSLAPAPGGGTIVDVVVQRLPRGLKGRLVAPVISLFGARFLRADLEKVLNRL